MYTLYWFKCYLVVLLEPHLLRGPAPLAALGWKFPDCDCRTAVPPPGLGGWGGPLEPGRGFLLLALNGLSGFCNSLFGSLQRKDWAKTIFEQTAGFSYFVPHERSLLKDHAEFVDLLEFAILAQIQGQTTLPNVDVTFRHSDNVSRLNEFTQLIPHRKIDWSGPIGNFGRSDFVSFFGFRRPTDLEDDEHQVQILHTGL